MSKLVKTLRAHSRQIEQRRENPLITWQGQEEATRRIERNSRIFWTVFWAGVAVLILFLAREYAFYLATKIGG